MKLRYHFTTTAIWWDTKANWEADDITRTDRGDDWRLRTFAFLQLWDKWGQINMDLMASAVNVQRDPSGDRLRFFSRFMCPGSAGIDILAQEIPPGQHFVFPHPRMVRAVVAHLSTFEQITIILVVQCQDGGWLPRVRGAILDQVRLPQLAVRTADGRSVLTTFDAFLLRF